MPSQPLVAATFDGFNSQFEMQKDEGGEKEDEEESFNSQFEMHIKTCLKRGLWCLPMRFQFSIRDAV